MSIANRVFWFFLALLLTGVSRAETVVLRDVLFNSAQSPANPYTVVIQGGVITELGQSVKVPADAIVHDLKGRVITAALTAVGSSLGGAEIEDGANANAMASSQPAVLAGFDVQYSLYPNASAIPAARRGGIASAVLIPERPKLDPGALLFSGQAAAFELKDAGAVQPKVAMVLDLSNSEINPGSALVQLESELTDVSLYVKDLSMFTAGKLKSRTWSQVDLDALVPVLQGKTPLLVKVDQAATIRHVLTIAERHGIQLILFGAAEGWRVADAIAAQGAAVIVDPVRVLPTGLTQLGSRLDNAALLHAAGVQLGFASPSWGSDARLLRYHAGVAVAHGLPRPVALAAVSTELQVMFGFDGQGLSAGAPAHVAVWSGDPFEPATQLEQLYISGVRQSLDSRSTQLRDRYRGK